MPKSDKHLSVTYEQFDDGLVQAWTMHISALPGNIEDKPGWIKQSKSISMSPTGPVETASFIRKEFYEFKRKIVIDYGFGTSSAEALDNIQSAIGDHVKFITLTPVAFEEKIGKNMVDPVSMISNVFENLGEIDSRLSKIFACLVALKNITVVKSSLIDRLQRRQEMSIDSIFRTMYSGMGIRIRIGLGGEITVTDLLYVINEGKGSARHINTSDILDFSNSLDYTQIPSAYTVVVNEEGYVTTAPMMLNLSRTSAINSNRQSIYRNELSDLSASWNPVRGVDFGLFRFVSLKSINATDIIKAEDGVVTITLSCGNGEDKAELVLDQKMEKVTDDFEQKDPSLGDFDYSPVEAVLFNMIMGYFQMATFYETIMQAQHTSIVVKGDINIKIWDTILLSELTIQGMNVSSETEQTFSSSIEDELLIVGVSVIIESGITRTTLRYVNMSKN